MSLTLVVACGGSSSDPEIENEVSPTEPGVEATVDGSVPDGSTPDGSAPEGPSASEGVESMIEGITEDPVAVVNGEEIALSEYEMQLNQFAVRYEQQGIPLPSGTELDEVRQEVLGQLIQQTLVIQESEARGITAEEDEIQAQYDEALATFPDEETFEQTMAMQGLTEDDVRALLEQNIRIQKLLDSVIGEADLAAPTEEEVQELYDQASQQQELPPLEEIRAQLESEIVGQREEEALRSFVEELEAAGEVEIRLNS